MAPEPTTPPGQPLSSRRRFLKAASLTLAGTAAGCHTPAPSASGTPSTPTPNPSSSPSSPAGMPPAFGTAPSAGPEVTPATFREADKLVQVATTDAELDEIAGNWRSAMAPLYERRTGPRKVPLGPELDPYSMCDPVRAANAPQVPATSRFIRTSTPPPPLPAGDPASDQDIAYSPVTTLSRWIEHRALTSERLTSIYLARLQRFNPQLRCVITLTADHALTQARAADKEIASGHYRGPLHGIPWGAKDLLDTAGIPTTLGAEPYRDRVPATDAAVTARLNAAGAVLVAKLSLGALALNDVWFGGQTMNPWLPVEGSSGSSAGPGAATAAGLVGFSIGSETGGSIVSPSMRCGVTGLRPTFGRVARNGAMTLCWSLDKLGPMARSVEDTLLVLNAISGPDPADPSSVPSKLDFDASLPVNSPGKALRVGYLPQWMHEAPATDVDRSALDTVKQLGMIPVEVSLPDWPYDNLQLILFAEAAASFEELTLSGRLHELTSQQPDAWPNTFRQARYLSAVDYVQADRLRRKVALEMARIFTSGPNPPDLLLVPSLRDEMLTLTNFTGHPSLTLRAGFVNVSQARSDWAPDPARPLPTFNPPRRVPHGITLIGRLFDEGTLGRAGIALERAFNVASDRPPNF